MILHLGVIDISYANAPRSKRAKKARSGEQTTGDVAQFLENDYGLMEYFATRHMDDVIEPALLDSVEGALENFFAGAPLDRLDAQVFGTAEGKIEDAFRKAIDLKEFDGLPGVPTQAALKGVDHRKAHPYAKRDARASFRDTGLFQISFRAWIE